MNPAISPARPSTSTAASTWRSALQIALVLSLTLIGGAQNALEFTLPWHPYGTFGFSAPNGGGRIVAVQPRSPAAKAGLHPGDRIDIDSLGLHERRRVVYLAAAPPGERLTLPVIRNGIRREVALVAVAYPRTLVDNVTNAIETLVRFAFLAIATALVLVRPSMLTWSFFLIAFAAQQGVWPETFLNDYWIVPFSIFANATYVAGATAAVVFAMLFPRAQPSRAVRNTAITLVLLGVALVAFDALNGYSQVYGWSARGDTGWAIFLNSLNNGTIWGMDGLAVVLFGVNYLHALPSERVRMQWVALGFTVGNWSLVAPGIVNSYVHTPLAVVNALLCLTIFIPLSVAYAIMKHRVIDVRFFISRALVYGTLTSIAVAVLALLDFAVSNRLEATRLGLAVEIGGAIAIGIGMNKLHGSIDALVDRYVFRSVHDAERRLRTVGKAMMFAQSESAIDEMFAAEAASALKLAYAHVNHELDPDAPLTMELQAERTAMLRGDDFIVPLFVRHRLLGCAAFGPHASGAAIDPNEREILERFSRDAAIAYDHAAAERGAAENAALREQLAIAQVRVDELRAVVRAQ